MSNRRIIAAVAGLLLVLGLGGLAGGAWFYSNELKEGALVVKHTPGQYDLEVVAIGDGQVTLGVTPLAKKDGAWTKEGIWGMKWDGGYNQVGAILDMSDREVVREFFPVMGNPDIGSKVRLEGRAFPDDPEIAFGIPFEEVSYSSPMAVFPAWFIDGSSATWVIFVHGRGSDRQESLRMLPTVVELGFPSLIIAYRNGREAPTSPEGFYRYGQTEWEDLEAAASYALEHGAQKIILVGYSMGGGVVMSFLYRSQLAGMVTGVILDSPMIDFSATIDYGASQRRIPVLRLPIPKLLTDTAKSISQFRFGIDWAALDYLGRADELDMPILVFHGDADDVVPVGTSDALAEARPDIVTYVRVQGATHVRSWNVDPVAYEGAVRDFLEDLTQ